MLSNYKKKIDLLITNNMLKSSVNIRTAEKKNKFEKNIAKILVNSKMKYFLWKINLITNISLYLYKTLVEMLSCKLTTNKNTQNFIITSAQNNNTIIIKQVTKQQSEESKLKFFPNISWLERENSEKNFLIYYGHNDMRSLLNDYGLFNVDILIASK